MPLSSSKRVGLFHVPMIQAVADLPHKEIEMYVRERMDAHKSYTSYYDLDFNKDLLKDLPHRKEMESQMRELSIQYLKMRGAPQKIWVDTIPFCWFSVYNEGDNHCLHNHPAAAVAGTYYPYADEESVPIRFKHPSSVLIQMSDLNFKEELWHFQKVHTGDMNVWPPWLEHQVGTQSKVDHAKARIAISFNFGKA